MNLRIQIIVGAMIILALIVVINMIRRNKLELKYALSWIAVGTVLLILDIFPILMQILSNAMGIKLPSNMMFFLGFCFSLIILFTLTIAVSRMAVRLKSLAQKVALLEKELENSRNIYENEKL